MRVDIRKKICMVLIAAVLALFAVLVLLGIKGMYQNIHKNINDSRADIQSRLLTLENAVHSLEGQTLLALPDAYKNTQLDYSWTERNPLIAHAFGSVTLDGYVYDYTNSQEAFCASYEKGFRVFEADLLLSSDGCLLAVHDWQRYGTEEPMSLSQFENGSFYDGKITQMTGEDVMELLVQYPDIYIVTDTKYTDPNSCRLQFSQLVYLAREKNREQVLDRLIVQVYNQSMYDILYEIYPWKSVIYTLYQSSDAVEDAISFCAERGIQVITMNYWATTAQTVEQCHEAGLQLYAFTVNDQEELEYGRQIGIDGFYTDSALPVNLE